MHAFESQEAYFYHKWRELNKESTLHYSMTSGTSSSGEIITSARGFQLTDQAVIQSYFSEVDTEWALKPQLPGITEKVKWTVYKLSPGLWKHFSLLFLCEDTAYRGSPGFTFELVCVVGGQSGNYVTPKTTIRQKGSGTTKLGVIQDSAEAIMNQGLNCLAKFGNYHKITNNCQSFCSKFAGELHISQPWTDGEKVGLGLVAAGVLGWALYSSASGDHQGKQKRRH